jgi:hypothetical protein
MRKVNDPLIDESARMFIGAARERRDVEDDESRERRLADELLSIDLGHSMLRGVPQKRSPNWRCERDREGKQPTSNQTCDMKRIY